MKLRTRMILLLAGPVLYALSCASPEAPAQQGSVEFRFDPSSQRALLERAGGVADIFDSVAVSVFRPGLPIIREATAGAAITVDPVELTIPCIAEANKRVSVELFVSGVMFYHGVNENVDVVANQRNDVLVDAYPFFVPSLSVTPQLVAEGTSFDLSWPSTVAARFYNIQASTVPDFSSIEWAQLSTDTTTSATLPAGVHYFRVAPQTPYATGYFAGPEGGYVVGGGGVVAITGFSVGGVIPGDTVSVLGENLDFPDVQVDLGEAPGGVPMEIVSVAWGRLVVRMPLTGTTNLVKVGSSLGSATSPDSLIALRVAYVTGDGGDAKAYANLLVKYRNDFGNSGMVTIPVEDLDWRDMNVFDIILVAHDTGATAASWGHGEPARAAIIYNSRANVVAIGLGGSTFLKLVGAVNINVPTTTTQDGEYYAPNGSAVFTAPHPVGDNQFVDFRKPNATTVDFTIPTTTGVDLYACTDASCILTICTPNNRWALADFRLVNPYGKSVLYFFWGYADDPGELESSGSDVFGNIMNLLYKSVTP